MAVTVTPRPNIAPTGKIEIIDGLPFEGFGSGGFVPDDLFIIGDETDNILAGNNGHDSIEGLGGNDIIYGGNGNDTLGGGAGDDYLDGQEGTDKLFGEAGNDILLAGHGHDILLGGSDADTFGFYALGHYEVQDFTIGEDRFYFDPQKTGINNIDELNSHITSVQQRGDGVLIEFGSNASVDLLGINFDDLTPEMVVYNIPGLALGEGNDTYNVSGGNGVDTFGFYALGHYQVRNLNVAEDRLYFHSEKIGIDNLGDLLPHITNVQQREDGVLVEFGPNASIDLVGVDFNDLTADMVFFNI